MTPYRTLLLSALLLLHLAPRGDAHEAHDPGRMHDAIELAQAQVTQATETLNAQRDAIAEKQKPLSLELEALRQETKALRQSVQQLRTARAQSQSTREALASEVSRLQAEFDFHFSLLQEYRRAFETRENIAEAQASRAHLAKIDGHLLALNDAQDFIAASDGLLRLAETWNRQKLGGTLHRGTCLSADGTELEGAFAVFGPATFFGSVSNATAGLVIQRIGSPMPSLWEAPESGVADSIFALLEGASVDLPLDTSGGDAMEISTQKSSLQEHLAAGGIIMIPLLLIGLIALLLTAHKWVTLARIKTPDADMLGRVAGQLHAGKITEAQQLINQLSPPFQTVLSAGVEYRGVPDSHMEEILQERALGSIPALDKHLGMLAVLGGVAPLLGLLGTVTGMIHTFEMVTIFGTGDAKLLSGGISEALVTTETGLVIAVPILIIHALLTRRVRTVIAALEQTVVGFMNRLHAPGPID